MMASAGLTSAHTALGAVPTHDGGGMIDLVLYDPARATALAQSTRNLNSDHHLLSVRFGVEAAKPVEATSGRPGNGKGSRARC
jgi:hypothetical protein